MNYKLVPSASLRTVGFAMRSGNNCRFCKYDSQLWIIPQCVAKLWTR